MAEETREELLHQIRGARVIASMGICEGECDRDWERLREVLNVKQDRMAILAGAWHSLKRLSIPGNACVHCGTIMGKSLQCPGCDWIDPMTRRVDA